jgi:hypothetical protein
MISIRTCRRVQFLLMCSDGIAIAILLDDMLNKRLFFFYLNNSNDNNELYI